jgi:glyoxylase-like metal-dependent hydrolase (beta-lactamase superfamily II)
MTMIEGIHPIPLGMVKAFLIESDENLVLIDTGYSPDHGQTILNKVQNLGRNPDDVELCIITHRHGDHIGGLKTLKETCNFKVASHEEEAELIETASGVAIELKLKDRQILPLAGGIEAVNVPGHTGGNLTLYLPGKKAILVGDTIFGDENGNLSPPPERYCENVDMATEKIKRLLDLDFDSVFLSHGKDVLEGGKEKVRNLVNEYC